MEVKIKNNEELIEADWTVEDGVMVVSPKEVKFEPKDGDVIVDALGGIHIMQNSTTSYCYFDRLGILDKTTTTCVRVDRPATEEEKQKLFKALADNGLEWDAEERQLVKLKWKPSVGQHFYYPEYDNRDCAFIIKAYTYAFEDQIERDKAIAKGWCFITSKECQEFCNRLNKALENIKP